MPVTSSPAPLPSLRSRMLFATQWVVLASGISHLLRLGSNLILTRLLVPEMFGLMSIASTVGVILAMLSDIGLRQAVVRSKRGDEPAFLDTVWTIQVIRGFVLWGGSLLAALGLYLATILGVVPAGSTYAEPILPWLVAVTGFWAAQNGLCSTMALTAARTFQLRTIFMVEFCGQIFGVAVMVLLAWFTRSIWALVIGSIASAGLIAILSHAWREGPRHRFRWDKPSVEELFSYGKWIAISSALSVFASNGDRLMLAAFAGAATLGLYSIVVSLVGALTAVIGPIFDKVMLPALSEVMRRNPLEIPAAYFRLRWRIDPIIMGISGFLFGSANSLIGVMYDGRYAGAGQMLQILSLGLIFSRYSLTQQVYLASGRTKYFVPINVLSLISAYTFIPIGYYFGGLQGALIGVAIRDVPSVILIMYFNSKHALNNLNLELGTFIFWPAGLAIAEIMHWGMSLRH